MSFFEFIKENPIWIFIIYLLLINLAELCLMAADKSRARRDKRRVPEASLFLLALLGGSIGGIAGMWLCRHKTKHLSFLLGFPVILALQLALCLFIIIKF